MTTKSQILNLSSIKQNKYVQDLNIIIIKPKFYLYLIVLYFIFLHIQLLKSQNINSNLKE